MSQLSKQSMGKDGEIIRNYEPMPGVKWRYGSAPDYSKVNKAYFEGRTKVHPEGSLEQIVQQSVKNWEVECHHVEVSICVVCKVIGEIMKDCAGRTVRAGPA